MSNLLTSVKDQIEGIDTSGLHNCDGFDSGITANTNVEVGARIGPGSEGGTFYGIVDSFEWNPERVSDYSGLKDRIVVDLGAGNDEAGYELARIVGAKGYVGVEPFYTRQLADALKVNSMKNPSLFEEREHIPYSVLCEDMLRTLMRIPDGSVSLMAGAIDDFIIPRNVEKNRRYVASVNDEIARVLHVNGVFIDYDSVFSPNSLKLEDIGDLDRRVWKFFK